MEKASLCFFFFIKNIYLFKCLWHGGTWGRSTLVHPLLHAEQGGGGGGGGEEPVLHQSSNRTIPTQIQVIVKLWSKKEFSAYFYLIDTAMGAALSNRTVSSLP